MGCPKFIVGADPTLPRAQGAPSARHGPPSVPLKSRKATRQATPQGHHQTHPLGTVQRSRAILTPHPHRQGGRRVGTCQPPHQRAAARRQRGTDPAPTVPPSAPPSAANALNKPYLAGAPSDAHVGHRSEHGWLLTPHPTARGPAGCRNVPSSAAPTALGKDGAPIRRPTVPLRPPHKAANALDKPSVAGGTLRRARWAPTRGRLAFFRASRVASEGGTHFHPSGLQPHVDSWPWLDPRVTVAAQHVLATGFARRPPHAR